MTSRVESASSAHAAKNFKMAQQTSWRQISKLANSSSSQACFKGIIKQALKKNGSNSFKGLIGDLSTANGNRRLSNAALQSIIKAAGAKNAQRFKFSEMQRCISSTGMVSKVASMCLIGSSSDSDLLEGSEDSDEVCSQGKQHSRRNMDTIS